MSPSVADEIARYLGTGDTDTHHRAWPSDSFLTRAREAHDDLRGALIAEVLRRTERAPSPDLPTSEQLAVLVRRKAEPMVRGLFPRAEQGTVLVRTKGVRAASSDYQAMILRRAIEQQLASGSQGSPLELVNVAAWGLLR